MLKPKIHKIHKSDYKSLIIHWKLFGFMFSWATQKNDPWRDDDDRPVHPIGLITHRGSHAVGFGIVTWRLKSSVFRHIK